MAEDKRPPRRATIARVETVTRLTPHMIRVELGGEGLAGFDPGDFTDAYVKLLFPAEGAAYGMPVDPADVDANHPAEHRPLLRTYTVRSWRPAEQVLTLDFVYHGDEGIAGPWAAAAKPGDLVSFLGPGGGYAPEADAEWHLFAGDESALPAIATALERLPEGAVAHVFLEVADAGERLPLKTTGAATTTWVHRDQGGDLVDAVTSADLPPGRPAAFVHGDADSVRQIRRFLRSEHGLAPGELSASGYWRRGRTDEAWRSEKRAWREQVESDDALVDSGTT
jgi:NADPH-dependent ferric siderophore reductase